MLVIGCQCVAKLGVGEAPSLVVLLLRRFSEDIDITYDIHGFAPDLVAGAGDEALPLTRSQERCWTKAGGRD